MDYCNHCNRILGSDDESRIIDISILINAIKTLINTYDFNTDIVYIKDNVIRCDNSVKVKRCNELIIDEKYNVFEVNKRYVLCIMKKWITLRSVDYTKIQHSAFMLAICLIESYDNKYEILQILESVLGMSIVD